MVAEFTQTLFSIKLCFYSLNISRSQAGAAANGVWLLMAFLHIPVRSSLAGRKPPTDSGHTRAVRRSKYKAAVELGLLTRFLFDFNSRYQLNYYSFAFSCERWCSVFFHVRVTAADTRCVSYLTDLFGLT